MKNIPSARPFFNDDDIPDILDDIKDILKGGILTQGPYLEKFERQFAEYIAVEHAIGVSSGTSALEIVLRYFDVRDREVIVPTNSFVASANTVVFAGGKPVLADIRADTLCLDPAEVQQRINEKTKGVMVVHLAGLICPQMDELMEICRHHNLFLLEDVAQAPGAMAKGQKAGSLGDAGCFSFFPTKPITTGEGGMITTNDSALAEFAKRLRSHGKKEHLFTDLGSNWRMGEINAVLGIHQLQRLEEYIALRNHVADEYDKHLASSKVMTPIPVPAGFRHSYYKYPVLFSEPSEAERIESGLRERFGIATHALYYPPIHLQPVYRQFFGYREGMLPVAENVLVRIRCLPMFTSLADEDIKYIISSLEELSA